MTEPYLILSCKYSRGSYCVWWRANSCGYTEWLDEAGRYSKEDAEKICSGSHGSAVPVPESVALALTTHQVAYLDEKTFDLFGEWREGTRQ